MFKNPTSIRKMPRPVKGLIYFGFAALFLFLLGSVIQFLWNGILAEATGVKTLSFWEALGLFVLARILFGGFRLGPRPRYWRKQKRAEWREKWMNMNEEERLAFKQKWKERCGKRNSREQRPAAED